MISLIILLLTTPVPVESSTMCDEVRTELREAVKAEVLTDKEALALMESCPETEH